MQDPKTRESEKTPEEAAALADFDFPRDPKEFLREIYKEAYNAKQDPDARISKVLGKCSSLVSHLAEKQERVHRGIRCLTAWLVGLTVALLILTVALLIYTAYLYKDAKQANEHANQTNTNPLQITQPPR